MWSIFFFGFLKAEILLLFNPHFIGAEASPGSPWVAPMVPAFFTHGYRPGIVLNSTSFVSVPRTIIMSVFLVFLLLFSAVFAHPNLGLMANIGYEL